MNKLFLVLFFIILLGGVAFWFMQNKSAQTQTDKLQVYASFYPLYFFASEIAGDQADIKNITPAGTEPHEYEPTAQDMAKIEGSDLLLLNGIVESWGDKMRKNLEKTDVKIIEVGDGLFSKQDPHIWLDPTLAKQEVSRITRGFVEIDPQNASYYQTNEKALIIKLDQLDKRYKEGLATCDRRDIITSHAAFAYLTERYGLRQVPIAGLSTEEEPTSQQLAEVSDFAKKNNVHYIFFESLVSPKLAEAIAQEVGAATLVLDPLEGIPQDKREQGENYFTIMEQNLQNLQKALQCSK